MGYSLLDLLRILFTLLSAAHAFDDNGPAGANRIQSIKLSLDAEIAFDTTYHRIDGPKAFAIGPDFIWDWYQGGPDPAADALANCNKQLPPTATSHCLLFARGNTILVPNASVGVHLYEPAPSGVEPFILGEVHIAITFDSKPIAIVLLFPGCKLCSLTELQPYAEFFASRRVALTMASSDSNMAELFRDLFLTLSLEQTAARSIKNMAFRADLTFELLKRKYPGVPVIVWGDALGGTIAQLAAVRADGMLITGSACHSYNRLQPGVETRFLFGDHDRRITNDMHTCGEAALNYSSSVVVIPGLDSTPLATNVHFRATFDELLELAQPLAP